ncbi:MAG: hypothetical protein IJ341_05045 [Bacteroidales bacterium]|nr:hypothetical protein [Bacteroidales bacterium]MBQ7819044.1 hypothetical protein [Bacteroidales bacterium]
MARNNKTKNRVSDGYKRNNLLSAMNKPGDNLATLSKELKKLAAFMHNSKNNETDNYEPKDIIEKSENNSEDNFSSINSFLESNGVKETSLDDILISEGYSNDYFAMNEETTTPLHNDKQINSIDSFIEAVENGEFSKSIEDDSEEEIDEDLLEEEEYNQPIDESFYTESLASIYIKQRKYARALEIIKSISLKNPEKNIYFADQIRFLEKLIINVKSE